MSVFGGLEVDWCHFKDENHISFDTLKLYSELRIKWEDNNRIKTVQSHCFRLVSQKVLSLNKSACRPTGGMWVRTVRIKLPLHKVMGLLPLYAPFSFPARPLPMSPGLGENVPLPSITSVQCCSPALLPLLVEESVSNGVECLWREDSSTHNGSPKLQTHTTDLRAAVVPFWRRLPRLWDHQKMSSVSTEID